MLWTACILLLGPCSFTNEWVCKRKMVKNLFVYRMLYCSPKGKIHVVWILSPMDWITKLVFQACSQEIIKGWWTFSCPCFSSFGQVKPYPKNAHTMHVVCCGTVSQIRVYLHLMCLVIMHTCNFYSSCSIWRECSTNRSGWWSWDRWVLQLVQSVGTTSAQEAYVVTMVLNLL